MAKKEDGAVDDQSVDDIEKEATTSESTIASTIRKIAAVILMLGVLVIAINLMQKQAPVPEQVATPAIGGPFTLIDQNGRTVTDKDLLGNFALIYFGYTYCPDICQVALSEMTAALDILGPEAARVQPVFITVDPARDTAEHLKEYASFFHPRLLALTGTPDQTAAAAKAYKVYAAKAEQHDHAPGTPVDHLHEGDDYLMDHTSIIYLMGPDGKLRSHFGHGTGAETIALEIIELL